MPDQMLSCPSCGIPQKEGRDEGENFLEIALAPVKKKYADFSGRARRKELWYFMLLQSIALSILQFISPFLYFIGSIVVLVPSLAVGARRLHDIDKSGWWQLLLFVPIIGWIILIVWACREGDSGPNRFGSDPKES